MSNRFVSADLLFQFQNAAIELAKKLGAAEARIAELERPRAYGSAGSPVCEHPEAIEQALRRMRTGDLTITNMPREPGKSTFHHMTIIKELVTMVQHLTRPADPQGRGWQHPPLDYVQQCRERIKGMI